MPTSHVATEYQIAVASNKNIPLNRIALAPVSADVALIVRIVYINGNTLSDNLNLQEAKTLGQVIQTIFEGLAFGDTLDWDKYHWVSLTGDNAFYFNGAADITGLTITGEEPSATDWTNAANTELQLP